MRLENLVEMIKRLGLENLNEDRRTHHARRYGGKKSLVKPRTLSMIGRYEGQSPQLAEEDEEKENEKPKKNGRTATGEIANKINTEVSFYSPVSPTQGSKPQVDTK